jgi:putative hydrolase of the HAD superfamily
MIKAVLFDLDNTLIDFMKMKKTCIEAASTAMADSGLKMSKKEIEKELFKVYDKYGIEYEKVFQKFLKKAEGKVDYKILASAIISYRKVKASFLQPYPGVEKTLLKLREKGLKLGIVTDAPKLNAWMRLVSLGIADFFDVVICSGKNKKPNSLPFRKALKSLKVEAEEALMVGDWPERDIRGAKKIGMKTCFAKYGYTKGKVKSGADHEIEKVEELLKIV